MSEISFRGVISVATTVGPSLLFVILHISQDPSIADDRKLAREVVCFFYLQVLKPAMDCKVIITGRKWCDPYLFGPIPPCGALSFKSAKTINPIHEKNATKHHAGCRPFAIAYRANPLKNIAMPMKKSITPVSVIIGLIFSDFAKPTPISSKTKPGIAHKKL
jgi:hypothetical protein